MPNDNPVSWDAMVKMLSGFSAGAVFISGGLARWITGKANKEILEAHIKDDDHRFDMLSRQIDRMEVNVIAAIRTRKPPL